MKIAILLSGKADVFSYTKDRILNQFDAPGIQIDFYCHTWSETMEFTHKDNKLSFYYHKHEIDRELFNHPRILNFRIDNHHFYENNLKKYKFIHLTDVEKYRILFLLGQSSSTKECYNVMYNYLYKNKHLFKDELWQPHNVYDIILKWRYDFLLDKDVPINYNAMFSTDLHKLHVIDGDHEAGMCDYFYYGDPQIMDSFVNNFTDYIEDYLIRAVQINRILKNSNLVDCKLFSDAIYWLQQHEWLMTRAADIIFGSTDPVPDVFFKDRPFDIWPRAAIYRHGIDINSTIDEIEKHYEYVYENSPDRPLYNF